jgi:hypothetical protein
MIGRVVQAEEKPENYYSIVNRYRRTAGDRSPSLQSNGQRRGKGRHASRGLFLPRRNRQGIPCHDIIKGTVSVAMTWQRRIDGETYL